MKQDIRASIDIGSNSVLLLIADLTNNKFIELSKQSFITSLGKDLDKNKAFHPESMASTLEALRSYAKDCDHYGIARSNIIATATEAARVAQNSAEFFQQIKDELDIDIQIITGQGEAYYTTRGILFNSKFNSDVITIMDIGGASTELTKVNTKTFSIVESISMPIGAVRASQWLEDDLFVQNLQKVFIDFRTELDKFQTTELNCVAGTMTALANMHLQRKDFAEEEVHGLSLKAEDIDSLFKRFSNVTPDSFLEQFPFLGKRCKSIRGGLHLAYHIVHRLLVKELTVSTYGLRYGTVLEGKIKKDFIHVR
jgi:exopolyphosphatase/guanosine-5'-triphosphate,3'-diphosphate pyrophosphatase